MSNGMAGNDMKLPVQFRTYEIDRATMAEDKRTVEISFASEAPVERWFGFETLNCDSASCDLSRLNSGGALLVDHNPSDQVGVVESARVDPDKKCRAVVRFGTSTRASEIYEDVKNKIRRLVSVGYRVRKMVTEKVEGDQEWFRVTDWQPLECSIVAIPADASVGIGRKENADELPVLIERKAPNMSEPTTVTGNISVQPTADPIKAERERVREINAIADRIKTDSCRTVARKFVDEGRSTDEFKSWVIENEYKAVPVSTSPSLGMSDNEVKRYSIIRAIKCLKDRQQLDGFEKEVNDEMIKKFRRSPDGLSFFIPYDVESRALTAGVFSQGGASVATELQPMIEMVRNQMFVSRMGARQLSGLVGDIAIPRQSGGATAYWLSETSTVTATTQAMQQVLLTPHRLAAATAYSNQFLAQTSLDAEAFVRQDLATVIAIEKDETAINGSGASGEPLGIVNTTSVTPVTFASTATMSYAEVVSFETALATSNTLTGNIGFLATPYRRQQARTTARFSSTDTPLWVGGLEGEFIGYKAYATNNVPSTKPIIFGNWSDLILADWAGTTILIDPYSLATKNQTQVIVQLMTDNAVRHATSFAIATQ